MVKGQEENDAEKVKARLCVVETENTKLQQKLEETYKEYDELQNKMQDNEAELENEKEVVDELRDKIAKLQNEKEKAYREKNKAMLEKTKLTQEKAKLEGENEKKRKLLGELQGFVECPVCLVVPREGPVPCCPAGHITCSPCHEMIRGEGRRECPTCRLPMGEGKSLLAKIILENMDHECSLEGCKAMVPHQEYKTQEACMFRMVICPGNNYTCKKMVAFCEVEE